jgi:hypothetical protein
MIFSTPRPNSFLKCTTALAIVLGLALSGTRALAEDKPAATTANNTVGQPMIYNGQPERITEEKRAREQESYERWQEDKPKRDAERQLGSSENRSFRSNDNQCRVSAALDPNLACDPTQNLVDVTQGVSALTTTIGTGITQASGSNGADKAQQSGKMSDGYRAAADTGTLSGNILIGGGTLDLLGAAVVITAAGKHKKAAKTINKDTSGSASDLLMEGGPETALPNGPAVDNLSQRRFISKEGGTVQSMLDRDGLIADDLKQLVPVKKPDGTFMPTGTKDISAENQPNANALAKKINDVGYDAAAEQQTMWNTAKNAGVAMIVSGAGKIMSGILAKKAAEEARSAADELDKIDEKLANAPIFSPIPDVYPSPTIDIGSFTPSPVPVGDPVAPPAAIVSAADPFSPRQATVLSPGTAATDPVAPPEESEKPMGGGLGDPFNNARPEGGPAILPAAGRLTDASGAGASGGGGGGLGGGSPTSAAQDQGGEGAPRLADSRGEKYQSGGGVYSGAGGGVGADKGPDLSGLLAALTKDDKKEDGKTNIMEYGRAPASEGGESGSLLDKSVNIFQRVHETYQDKNRQGAVGLAKLGPKASGG